MKKKELTIHEKAIRLIEGGEVNINGHRVKMKISIGGFGGICYLCQMDSICVENSEMSSVCQECDKVINKDCFLELVTIDQ